MRICVYSSYAWIKIANNYGSILQYFALQKYLEKNVVIRLLGYVLIQVIKLR